MQKEEAAPAAPSKLFPGGAEPSAKLEAPAGGSALQLAVRRAGTWVVLPKPGRRGRAHAPASLQDAAPCRPAADAGYAGFG